MREIMRLLNVPAEVNTSLMARNTMSALCAGLPVRPEPSSKSPIPLEEPLCVKWCLNEALIYQERREEAEEEEKLEEMEIGLESLIDRYGLQSVIDAVSRKTEVKPSRR